MNTRPPRPFLPLLLVLLSLSAPPLVAQEAPAAAPPAAPNTELGPWNVPPDNRAGLRYLTFPSKLAGTDVSYTLYLPPGYDDPANRDRRYPVVYWLHGRNGGQSGCSAFTSRLDPAIKAGRAPAMIVVGVNGRKVSGWVDSPDGKSPVQSVLIRELIPLIDATCRTLARREARGVEGFSMGGGGAARLGFKYPELFGVVGILSGAVRAGERPPADGATPTAAPDRPRSYGPDNDPALLVEKNAALIRGRTFVRMAVGGKDRLLGPNTGYHELLTRLKIEHSFDIAPDATHSTPQVYDGLGDKSWTFYTRAFGSLAP